jgi:hypothetical protein
MRKLNTLALALIGVALAVGSLSFALAANTATPPITRRAVVPGVAGDTSTFNPGSSTSTPTPTPEVFGCAGLRTNIKILADDDAGFDRTAVASSLFALVNAERPDGITDSSPRFAPFESRVVEVTASLVGFRRTSGGGIELVISAGPGGDLMAASFPSQSCLANASDADRAAANAARIALMQKCGNAPDSGVFKPLGGTATLQGVPFWGAKHTDGYGSPSGIELGPVLKFDFNPATECSANAKPTPTPSPTTVVSEILTSVYPQSLARGDELQITILTVPRTAGKLCGYQLWDAEVNLVSSSDPVATGADGLVTWSVTIPGDMPIGQARVQPNCPGLPTNGSAPFMVTAN